MATAAGDFLSVLLAVIVRNFDISEHLAGVTIFAFGNGCSDLFSTLAAMISNNGGLAIGEMFRAAAFITTVVLGLTTRINHQTSFGETSRLGNKATNTSSRLGATVCPTCRL